MIKQKAGPPPKKRRPSTPSAAQPGRQEEVVGLSEILRVEQVTKVYGNGILANDKVEMSLNKGEIHAICGENGAGKSTLMKMLFGLEQPDEGTIYVKGKPERIASPSAAIALGIGMVHQHFMLVDELTVAENVVLGYEPKKGLTLDMAGAVAMTAEVGKKYNLEVDPTALVGDISVGLKQRVEIVKALLRGAEILILDEPTAVLTPQETRELFVELKNLRDAGHTILFISHKLGEVKELCDRITIMRAGRTVGTYDVAGLTEADISRLMVGRDVVLKIDKEPPAPGETELKVRDLEYTNDLGKKVVRGVSLDVRRGEILGIAGVEGNGQRELVEIVTGLRSGAKGEVSMSGVSILDVPIKQSRALGIAHIPSDRMVYGVARDQSIEFNILAGKVEEEKYNSGILFKTKQIEQDMEELARDYTVKCRSAKQAVGMLSGGNIQKVVVAREMSGGPRLLVADQPTRGIDVGAAEFIRRRIVKMRDEGAAILLVTADLNEALELSDSIVVMHGGEIVAYYADTRDLTEEELGFYMLGVKRQTPEEVRGVVHE
ncbi:MAG: ABC transporter ATP-binding protein [Clostridia bacterium]|nr:ABC transporter ATP-binding protein [Clostridia bacterium]